MKRDMDLIRTMLIKIEEYDGGNYVDFSSLALSDAVLYYHARLLRLAGFIEASNTGQHNVLVSGLTWAGHEFLDDIRSDTVWTAIKDQAGPAFGTVSLSIMAEMAKAYIKDQFGIP